MNQSNAEAAAQQMADAIAAKTKRLSNYESVRKDVYRAVFNQARDFIPESAIFHTLDSRGKPELVALDGRQLFLLTVGNLPKRMFATPRTRCEMLTLDPLDAAVACETEFVGLGDDPDERQTTWTFRLGRFGLRIDTHVSSENERTETGEAFAQALVAALGWEVPTAARTVVPQVA